MEQNRTVQMHARLKVGILATLIAFFVASIAVLATPSQAQAESLGTVDYTAQHLNPQTITDTDGSVKTVYCINEGRAYKDDHNQYSNKRTKYLWNAALDAGAHADTGFSNALAFALIANQYDSNGTRSDYPGAHEFTPNDVVNSSACADLLAKILYYGYPNNGGNDNFTEEDTQDAVYWAIYSGKDNTEYGNAVVNKALANDVPAEYSLYVYTITPEELSSGLSTQEMSQMCVNAEFKQQSTPETVNTTVKKVWSNADGSSATWPSNVSEVNITVAYGTDTETITLNADKTEATTKDFTKEDGASFTVTEQTIDGYTSVVSGSETEGFTVTNTQNEEEKPAEPTIATSAEGTTDKTIAPAADQTITDTVTFSNLDTAIEYTLTGKLMNKATKTQVATYTCTPVKFKPTAASGTQTVDFTGIDASALAVGAELVVFETLSWTENGTEKTVKHENYDDTAQTITVDEAPAEPAIGTVVAVNNVTATAGTVLNLTNTEIANALPVKDTIGYTGLTAGEKYTVVGNLMKVTGSNEDGSPITESIQEVALSNQEAEDSSGTWTMVFGDVQFEEDSYYVVYEELRDASGTTIAEHKKLSSDNDSLSQSINVGNGWESVFDTENKPTFTPVFKADPKLSTTVSINDKAASSQEARAIRYSDAAKVKTVTDKVHYEGIEPGTYSLYGEVHTVTNGVASTKPVFEASKDNIEISSSTGDISLDFTDVTLQPNTIYVVFEYLRDSQGNEIAKHEDVNDKAQTIVVGERPVLPSNNNTVRASSAARSTTAKTADDMGGATVAGILVAAAAAGVAFAARRRFEK